MYNYRSAAALVILCGGAYSAPNPNTEIWGGDATVPGSFAFKCEALKGGAVTDAGKKLTLKKDGNLEFAACKHCQNFVQGLQARYYTGGRAVQETPNCNDNAAIWAVERVSMKPAKTSPMELKI
jgi:hypothetical protein